MSIKKDLLAEIEKKAQKIRDRRIAAANNKSIEAAAFDFFKNIEESREVHGGTQYNTDLFYGATSSLQERIRGIDSGAKVEAKFPDDGVYWELSQVQGITIYWSKNYIAKHNVDPTLFIDISSMLLF